MRKLIYGSLLAASLAVALPAAARTHVDFVVNFAPPALPYEVVPAPRAGYVWIPGYWDWRYSRYHWVRGSWAPHRVGYYYQPVRWVYSGGRYYRRGGWRDSDWDGVPNRFDRAPYNPYWR
ncbi:MAG TPA: hypothetical protein VM073_07440 [Usitatibacter sp.]|nr:hypothetical protein [Usitatibacter sp.]